MGGGGRNPRGSSGGGRGGMPRGVLVGRGVDFGAKTRCVLARLWFV